MLAALAEPEKFKNVFVPVYDQLATPGDLVKTFAERTGVRARRAPALEVEHAAEAPSALRKFT